MPGLTQKNLSVKLKWSQTDILVVYSSYSFCLNFCNENCKQFWAINKMLYVYVICEHSCWTDNVFLGFIFYPFVVVYNKIFPA